MSTTVPSDDELARRAATGDRAATDALVERYRTLLVGFLRKCLKVPEQDIDDMAGDTWERILRALPKRKDGNFLAWVRKIARNIVLDGAKKKRATADTDAVTLVPAREEKVVETDPKLMQCLELLQQSNPKYHAAVIAVYLEAQPQDEAAAAFGIEPGTFRTQLFKAKAKLRDCIGERNR